jgi:molybdopterin-guanine dinucleotide biosynthesis protein A
MPDSRTEDALGLVLAGGQSTRFGTDKALVPVGGVPMARLVYNALAVVIRDVRVGLSVEGERNPVPGSLVILDDPRGVGPMGSLRAALLAAGSRWVLAAACDMPGLKPESVQRLLGKRSEEVDAVVAVDETGRLHPLAAAWSPRVLPHMSVESAGRGRSLTGLLERVRMATVRLDSATLRNVNSPADLGAHPPM